MNKLDFTDAQQMSIDYPKTFEAPLKKDLNKITVGNIVKVATSGEKFWTIITEINGDKITATVNNDLLMRKLKFGDIIHFEKRHICSIHE